MKLHRYPGLNFAVTYDSDRCIHAAECVHGLPKVFDPEAKPWINPEAASADEIAAVIRRCPTGALHFETADRRHIERADAENTITISADGPLYCRGDVRIVSDDGQVLLADTRVALCRCGASAHKPLCDNAHQGIHFSDPGTPTPQEGLATTAKEAGGTLTVTPHKDGPLQLNGNLAIHDAFGDVIFRGDEAWLCRCGGSAKKPFCDGTHKKNGFKS